MPEDDYPQLKLENQLCFPLYAASREITRLYTPYLEPLDLTYTQYLVMLYLWEREFSCPGPNCQKLTELGNILMLDSGTLTPLLKKLELKGYITRTRDEHDERGLNLTLTEKGQKLKEQAKDIPPKIAQKLRLTPEEAEAMHRIAYKIINNLTKEQICKN